MWRSTLRTAFDYLTGVIIGIGIVLCALLLASCTGAIIAARHSRETLPLPKDATYTKTLSTMNQMGWKIVHSEPQAGIINAEVRNAAVVGVTLEGLPEGTQVSVSCTPMADKLVVGACTAGEDLLARLR